MPLQQINGRWHLAYQASHGPLVWYPMPTQASRDWPECWVAQKSAPYSLSGGFCWPLSPSDKGNVMLYTCISAVLSLSHTPPLVGAFVIDCPHLSGWGQLAPPLPDSAAYVNKQTIRTKQTLTKCWLTFRRNPTSQIQQYSNTRTRPRHSSSCQRHHHHHPCYYQHCCCYW